MAAPGGLIPCRRVENIHGSLKSDEAVSHELPLGWRYAKRSLKIPGKYPLAVHFPLARGNHPLIRAKLSGIRASRGRRGMAMRFLLPLGTRDLDRFRSCKIAGKSRKNPPASTSRCYVRYLFLSVHPMHGERLLLRVLHARQTSPALLRELPPRLGASR